MTDRARLAAAVRDAALAVPGVTGLTGGAGPVEVATLFPGGKVTGVRFGEEVEVHVGVDRVPVDRVAERVRRAVRDAVGGGCPVVVVVDDLDPSALTRLSGAGG